MSEKLSAGAWADYSEHVDVIGSVSVNGRTWWVVQISVEDGYSYHLFDAAAAELLTFRKR